MEPTYTRRDAEDIFAAAKVESLGLWGPIRSVQSQDVAGWVIVNDDGVWLDERAIGLLPAPFDPGWKPCHELKVLPGQPGPRETPALPFPFTARQLAAFMLDGAGWFVRDAFGDWEVGPDPGLLAHPEHVKAREAVHAAYEVWRESTRNIAEVDPALEAVMRKTETARDETEALADLEHAPREQGISEIERSARWEKYLSAVGGARSASREAERAYWSAFAERRKTIVRALLAPAQTAEKRFPLSREAWEMLSNEEKARAWWMGQEPKKTPEEEHLHLIGWYDSILRASYWFDLSGITPVEAAQIMSKTNPHDAGDWLASSTPSMDLSQRRELLRGFEDKGGSRPLVEWIELAKERGWRYDPWVDEYRAAGGGAARDPRGEDGSGNRMGGRAIDLAAGGAPVIDEWERLHQRIAELSAERTILSDAQQAELETLHQRKSRLDIRRRWLRGDGHGQSELDFYEGLLRAMVGAVAWDAWSKLSPVSAADAALLVDGIDPDSTQARGGPSRLRRQTMEAIGGDGRPRRLKEWLADLIQFERQVESREACESSVLSIQNGSVPPPAERQVIQRMKKSERRDALTPIIEQAMQKCKDQTDAAEVWGHLSAMAEKKAGPLLGSTEDGIQYLKDGLAASLTKDALRKRVGRMSGRIPP